MVGEEPSPDEDPAMAELSAIQDADELCRRLLESAWGWGSSSRCAEAVDLLARVRGTGTLPDAFLAMLLCTCGRWGRVTAKLIAAVGDRDPHQCRPRRAGRIVSRHGGGDRVPLPVDVPSRAGPRLFRPGGTSLRRRRGHDGPDPTTPRASAAQVGSRPSASERPREARRPTGLHRIAPAPPRRGAPRPARLRGRPGGEPQPPAREARAALWCRSRPPVSARSALRARRTGRGPPACLRRRRSDRAGLAPAIPIVTGRSEDSGRVTRDVAPAQRGLAEASVSRT